MAPSGSVPPRWRGPEVHRNHRRDERPQVRARAVASAGVALLQRSALQLSSLKDPTEQRLFNGAFTVSVLGHLLGFSLMVFNFSGAPTRGQGIVYSVSIEGGTTLGGVSQVAKEGKQSPMAPAKKVSAAAKEEKSTEKAEKDAEVSLADQKKAQEQKRKEEQKKEAEKKAKEKAEQQKKKKQEDIRKKPADTKADLDKDYQKALQRYLGESSEAGGQGFGAGKITGGKGMGGGVQMPPEFFLYRQALRNKVKSGWNWFNTSAALTTWVTFKISREGVISDVQLAESSGNREFDESVLRAVAKASPLAPPPASVFDTFKEVKMSFDPRE